MVFRHLTHPAACRCDGASQRRLEGRAFTVNGCPLVTSKPLETRKQSETNTRGAYYFARGVFCIMLITPGIRSMCTYLDMDVTGTFVSTRGSYFGGIARMTARVQQNSAA